MGLRTPWTSKYSDFYIECYRASKKFYTLTVTLGTTDTLGTTVTLGTTDTLGSTVTLGTTVTLDLKAAGLKFDF